MPASEISREQEYVAGLYERVDAQREQASARLARALKEDGGTPQSRLDRDAAIARYTGQLARLDAADSGLCFGRLDLKSGECLHIGRIGLRDEADEGEPLLLDWRAPAARAFYVATARSPHGVRRRRHIAMRGRRVTGLDDEVLDAGELASASGLTGEAALLAALDATRTGRMGDIVATLQAEQDAIIRSAPSGILVVQGGPGTGKTAVALHRAAYLLYTHQHLAARGVLVVGPSATFLGYISQVLPGLGETNVLLRTVGELFPGVTADRAETPLAEEVKGRAMMAGVLAAAVRDRQAAGPAEIEFAGETLRLDAEVVREATRRARASRLPHNQARPLFQRHIVPALARRYAERTRELAERLEADVADVLAEASAAIEADLAAIPEVPGSAEDEQVNLADLRRELWADPDVRAQLDDLWPALTPQRLLEDLFADPARHRRRGARPDRGRARRAAARARRLERRRRAAARRGGRAPRPGRAGRPGARGARSTRSGSRTPRACWTSRPARPTPATATRCSPPPTSWTPPHWRNATRKPITAPSRSGPRPTAPGRSGTWSWTRRRSCRRWPGGCWRAAARRRSMTIVGDVAQTGSAAGTTPGSGSLSRWPATGGGWPG